MGVYPVSVSDRTEPLDETPTPAEIMDRCIHSGACRMQWEMNNGPFVDGSQRCMAHDWMDRLARLLGCDEDCTEWEG